MSSNANYVEKDVWQNRNRPSLLQYACDNKKKGFFNDVTITAGKESYQGNKLILSCYSEYFEEEFRCKNKNKISVEVENTDGKSLKFLLDYLYTGSIAINSNNVLKILYGPDQLRLKEVKQYCWEYVESLEKSSFTPDFCFDILEAAKKLKNLRVQEIVYNYIISNYHNVSNSTLLKNLPYGRFFSFLMDLKKCYFVNHDQFCQSIVEWTKYEEQEIEKHFSLLFKLVDLNRISSTYFKKINDEDLIQENEVCIKLINEALLQKQLETCKKTNNFLKVLSIGGTASASKVVEVYNSSGLTNRIYPGLPESRPFQSSLSLNNVVYSIGGSSSQRSKRKLENLGESQKVFSLDLTRKTIKWEENVSLNEKKRHVGATVFKNAFVVCGGNSLCKALSSCEYLKPEVNGWRKCSPLKYSRFAHQLVTCKQSLFALGGWNGKNYLSTVEKLVDLKQTWHEVTPMQEARGWFSAVSLNGFIYAFGGKNQNGKIMRSTEKYNCLKQKWSFCSNMKIGRYRHSACVFNGKIIVVGGINYKNQIVKEIEIYDPVTKVWEIVGETELELFDHSLVVVTI